MFRKVTATLSPLGHPPLLQGTWASTNPRSLSRALCQGREGLAIRELAGRGGMGHIEKRHSNVMSTCRGRAGFRGDKGFSNSIQIKRD